MSRFQCFLFSGLVAVLSFLHPTSAMAETAYDLSGKWRGILHCNRGPMTSEVKISGAGNKLRSKWKNTGGHSNVVHSILPTSGLGVRVDGQELELDTTSSRRRESYREVWQGYYSGGQTIIFLSRNETISKYCTAFILTREKALYEQGRRAGSPAAFMRIVGNEANKILRRFAEKQNYSHRTRRDALSWFKVLDRWLNFRRYQFTSLDVPLLQTVVDRGDIAENDVRLQRRAVKALGAPRQELADFRDISSVLLEAKEALDGQNRRAMNGRSISISRRMAQNVINSLGPIVVNELPAIALGESRSIDVTDEQEVSLWRNARDARRGQAFNTAPGVIYRLRDFINPDVFAEIDRNASIAISTFSAARDEKADRDRTLARAEKETGGLLRSPITIEANGDYLSVSGRSILEKFHRNYLKRFNLVNDESPVSCSRYVGKTITGITLSDDTVCSNITRIGYEKFYARNAIGLNFNSRAFLSKCNAKLNTGFCHCFVKKAPTAMTRSEYQNFLESPVAFAKHVGEVAQRGWFRGTLNLMFALSGRKSEKFARDEIAYLDKNLPILKASNDCYSSRN